ncbi:hypothetical protein UY3_10786 [Chelonia mydas]|uniref:Uncharacterized protein n=1 Tax=Chelonia mydas TaxID=8469 RepID=M7B953_CHEMY|nr:hypothetical protein UY3_10786 [Chelonia mydas]
MGAEESALEAGAVHGDPLLPPGTTGMCQPLPGAARDQGPNSDHLTHKSKPIDKNEVMKACNHLEVFRVRDGKWYKHKLEQLAFQHEINRGHEKKLDIEIQGFGSVFTYANWLQKLFELIQYKLNQCFCLQLKSRCYGMVQE